MRTVRINGIEYELKHPDKLQLHELAQLNLIGVELRRLGELGDEAGARDAYRQLVEFVLKAPSDVIRCLSDDQLDAIGRVFLGR